MIALTAAGQKASHGNERALQHSCSCSNSGQIGKTGLLNCRYFFTIAWIILRMRLELFSTEAIAAIDGTIALWLKRYPRRGATFGTAYFSGSAGVVPIPLYPHQNAAIRTALRFINQPLSAEKFLFSRAEDESLVAVAAG